MVNSECVGALTLEYPVEEDTDLSVASHSEPKLTGVWHPFIQSGGSGVTGVSIYRNFAEESVWS